MRKIFASLIILTCIFTFTACGTNTSEEETMVETTASTENNETVIETDGTENIETTAMETVIRETATEDIIIEDSETEDSETENSTIQETIMQEKKLLISIGNVQLEATLEDNESVTALLELIKESPLTINFSQYGGFEQVGRIGTTLPSSDTHMTTSPGDIVLYSGNQLVMFYGSNSWSYTKIGKIDVSQSELKDILSNGDVTATFSVQE